MKLKKKLGNWIKNKILEEKNKISQEDIKRTPQLTLLCILSFIAGGLSIIGNMYIYGFYDQLLTLIKEGNIPQFFGEEMDYSFLADISQTYFIWLVLLNVSSVIGVFLMWKLNSVGFHVYALSEILILIVPEIYIPGRPFPFFDIMITLVFVLLYFKNLKLLGRL